MTRAWRKRLLATTLAAVLVVESASPAHAILGVGDIVFDPAAVAQLLATVDQLAQSYLVLQQQLTQVINVYNQAVTTYNSITGIRDVGSALTALGLPTLQNPFPGDVATVQQLISGQGIGSLPGTLNGLLQGAMAGNGWMLPSAATDWRTSQMIQRANGIAGTQAMMQYAYQNAASRLNQLQALKSRLAMTQDMKEVADIHAAITAVQTDLQNQEHQLSTMRQLAETQREVNAEREEQYDHQCNQIQIAFYSGASSSQACPVPSATGSFGSSGGAVASTGTGLMGGTAGDVIPPSSLPGGGTGTASDALTTAAAGGPDALANLQGQSYGAQAIATATGAGVNASTLAALMQGESNFQNVCNSTACGVGQMIPATYAADAAAAGVPTDAASRMDPSNMSAAMTVEISKDAQLLQGAGVSPTGLDIKGAYEWGPGNAVALSNAPDSALMSDLLVKTSDSAMKGNGVTPGVTTVGEWRASVVKNAGQAILQPAMNTTRL